MTKNATSRERVKILSLKTVQTLVYSQEMVMTFFDPLMNRKLNHLMKKPAFVVWDQQMLRSPFAAAT